jgi:hypothetical protein
MLMERCVECDTACMHARDRQSTSDLMTPGASMLLVMSGWMDRIRVLSESIYCFVHASNEKLLHYTDGVAPPSDTLRGLRRIACSRLKFQV